MKESHEWTEADIISLVKDRAEESLTLEFKSCNALRNKKWQEELAKDVSAFANSAGGTIVYGIKEHKITHEADEIDEGFDPSQLNKETIQRVIDSRIHRRVVGIRYNVVELATTRPGRVLFVLEIPESNLAPHMAGHKFFKRFEFESKPMEEYEIRERYRRETFPGKDIVEAWRDDAINPLISALELEKQSLLRKEWTWNRHYQVFGGFIEFLNEPTVSANKEDFINRHSEIQELILQHDAAVATLNAEGKTLYERFARSPILKEIFDRTTSEQALLQLKEANPNGFRGSTGRELFDELFGVSWKEQEWLECFAQWAINSKTEANVNPMLLFWRNNDHRFHKPMASTDYYHRVIRARESLTDVIESLISFLKRIRKDLSERHNIPHEARQQLVNVYNDPLRL